MQLKKLKVQYSVGKMKCKIFYDAEGFMNINYTRMLIYS